MRAGSGLVEALLDAWALLQPVECAGCGAPDRGVCRACAEALAGPPVERWVEGLAPPVIAAGPYGGVLRRMLLAGKDHGRGDALRALAPLLARAVHGAASRAGGRPELAWVPSRRAALRRRGEDPVLTMLRAARLPVSRVLVARSAPPQKALDRSGRIAAAPQRLLPVGVLVGRRFLLVDDVVTTGATLRAAASAIAGAGGEVIAAACVAAVERTSTSFRDIDPNGG